jgi:ribosomal protein S27E
MIPEKFAKAIVLAEAHTRASDRTNEKPRAVWIVAFAVDECDRATWSLPRSNSEVRCIGCCDVIVDAKNLDDSPGRKRGAPTEQS